MYTLANGTVLPFSSVMAPLTVTVCENALRFNNSPIITRPYLNAVVEYVFFKIRFLVR
jgi:hypothetical protein